MKKLLCSILVLTSVLCAFAKELVDKDLEAVNQVKDAILYAEDFEELDEQLSYMDNVKNKIEENKGSLSEEAQFLCNAIINQEKFQLTDNMLQKQEEEQNSEEIKKEREEKTRVFAEKQLAEYKEFESAHTDLSSCFYFHYKKAEMETVDSLPSSKQMKLLKNICKDFESIEKKNPEYAENLYTYGLMLYMLPGIYGGNVGKGLKKIQKAIENAETTYDKVNGTIIFSQICFDANLQEEWSFCMEALESLLPGSKHIAEIKKLNEAGQSAFIVY